MKKYIPYILLVALVAFLFCLMWAFAPKNNVASPELDAIIERALSEETGEELEIVEDETDSATNTTALNLENLFPIDEEIKNTPAKTVTQTTSSSSKTSTTPALTWKPVVPVVENTRTTGGQTGTENSSEQTLSLRSANIQYTKDWKIFVDVRDNADSDRLRYAAKGVNPIKILAQKYNLGIEEVLDIAHIDYRQLTGEMSRITPEIIAADTYVTNGHTLVSIMSTEGPFFFWVPTTNTYHAVEVLAPYLRMNKETLWDEFFVIK